MKLRTKAVVARPYRPRVQRKKRADAVQGSLQAAARHVESARRVVFGEPLTPIQEDWARFVARERAETPKPTISKKEAAWMKQHICVRVPPRRRAELIAKALREAALWCNAARLIAAGEPMSEVGVRMLGLVKGGAP